MFYDKELDRWFLTEFHRDRYKKCLENDGWLEKPSVISHETAAILRQRFYERLDIAAQKVMQQQDKLKVVFKLIYSQERKSTYTVFEFQEEEWITFLRANNTERKKILLQMSGLVEKESHYKLFIQAWEPLSKSKSKYEQCLMLIHNEYQVENRTGHSLGGYTNVFLDENRDELVDILMWLCAKKTIHRTDWALALAQIENVILTKENVVYVEGGDIIHSYYRYRRFLRSTNSKLYKLKDIPLIQEWFKCLEKDISTYINNGEEIDIYPYPFIKKDN